MTRILPRLAALGALLFWVGTADAAPVAYQIDKGHSTLLFKVKHLNVGYQYGRFNDFSGSVVVDDENLANAKVEIEVATTSVDTADEARDKHLRNADFFDVEKHPTMSFESTTVKKEGAIYIVDGNFTLLGTTKPLTLRLECLGEAEDPWGNHRRGYEGTFKIKRSEYGMDKMIPMIGDEVAITLAIEVMRKK